MYDEELEISVAFHIKRAQVVPRKELRNNGKPITTTTRLLDFADKEDILRRSHKLNGARYSIKKGLSRETIKVRICIGSSEKISTGR